MKTLLSLVLFLSLLFIRGYSYAQIQFVENKGQWNNEVKFKQDEITSRVTYDKEGNIIKTYRYYREDRLPLMVLAKLKTRYPDKSIYGVVEESSEEGTTYHVTLEDAKNWLDVRADLYGGIYQVKKMKKA